MKAIILAGGKGTRIVEETQYKPKPMIDIAGKPILWHILKIYSTHGINDFIICCGYKGYVIKEYFANYFLHMSDITFDLNNNQMEVHQKNVEPWKITLLDTGYETMTAGRLLRVKDYVINEEKFCLTYGDGVYDINIKKLLEFHEEKGLKATVTAVQPPGRFGSLEIKDDKVLSFIEKPIGDKAWINGGYFVFSPSVFDYIDGDQDSLEEKTLIKIACDSQLSAYKHTGYWQPMDTLRDKNILEDLWSNKKAPWKKW